MTSNFSNHSRVPGALGTSGAPSVPAAPAARTIAAIATPLGRGGVGIVRVSGPAARAVLAALFRASDPRFTEFAPRHLHHGALRHPHTREPLDEALAVLMPGPHSFTGEDVAEFHCHGGPAVLAGVLEAAYAAGAEPAAPGEFTRRAFLNGRMDLTRAEAVAELIAADTAEGAHLARAKLSGRLGERIRALRGRLEQLRAELCVAVDFPEDEVECLAPERFAQSVEEVLAGVGALLESYARSRCWRDGALAVLAGRVNAGKSSLLNALLGRNRAIVSAAPGTTRDFIEETLNLGGLPVRIVDTAGLRETCAVPEGPAGQGTPADGVELEGMRLGRELMDRADLVLLVADATRPVSGEDRALAHELGPGRVLVVANKTDLCAGPALPGGPEAALAAEGFEVAPVSARSGAGVDTLAARVRERLTGGRGEPDAGELVPNLRQSLALERAREELAALLGDIRAGVPYDLLGVRLEGACAVLAEITGEIAPQEVLDAVFDRFCIGK
ncbi:MAG: tRNA uridine-5-carboxymethylaminomethyl(34) synthesis GTPase MnmE [Desulfovibrionaceae bacterium]|jgi:tRNA modification GTPase|nr:tRNA uridine-5-carboxymethylaminomethyl(34) synthesis GTPase MnmE [Desulfovibrionaceae bacterium]